MAKHPQGLYRNNRAFRIDGEWQLMWEGKYTVIPEDEALRFNEQEPEELLLDIKELTGNALMWAVSKALDYDPFMMAEYVDGTLLGGGRVQPSYEGLAVIAHFEGRKRFGPFRVGDYAKCGPLLDLHRVSTEIAGDGWSALYKDTFCKATERLVLFGDTRLEAGLRAIAVRFLGPQAKVPAELVHPDIRRRILHNTPVERWSRFG